MLQHLRQCHPELEILDKIGEENGVKINHSHPKPLQCCKVCAMNKAKAKPAKKKKLAQYRATKNLERIHADICGPLQTTSRTGKRYIITFVDEKTKTVISSAIAKKSEAPIKLKEALDEFERLDPEHKVRKVRTDNAKELSGEESRAWKKVLEERNIEEEHSAPYSPHQNGLAERYNRIIMDMVRCNLYQANQPENMWEDALQAAIYVLNRRYNKGTKKIPLEDLTGKKEDLSHLRAYGATAYVKIQPPPGKLKPNAQELQFVGYVKGAHGTWKFWDGKARKIVISRDAQFDESNIIERAWPIHSNLWPWAINLQHSMSMTKTRPSMTMSTMEQAARMTATRRMGRAMTTMRVTLTMAMTATAMPAAMQSAMEVIMQAAAAETTM
jgi:hypothetical protein